MLESFGGYHLFSGNRYGSAVKLMEDLIEAEKNYIIVKPSLLSHDYQITCSDSMHQEIRKIKNEDGVKEKEPIIRRKARDRPEIMNMFYDLCDIFQEKFAGYELYILIEKEENHFVIEAYPTVVERIEQKLDIIDYNDIK